MQQDNAPLSSKVLDATVIVAALGYLVDIYDFFIFNIVRVPSLSDLGLSGPALTETGLHIINLQLTGILIGSYLWGVIGDKFGRKSCLLASILIYSLATIYCSIVKDADLYGYARFFAGLGIGGELGVGLTLISEKLSPRKRGYGVCIFFALGFSGVLVASLAVQILSWRDAYLAGGVAGLLLLLTRAFVLESGLYEKAARTITKRGGLSIILNSPALLKKYLAIIFIMSTSTFMPQIMMTLAPELARAQGIAEPVKASTALLLGFGSGIFSTVFTIFWGEKLRSRKKAMLASYIAGTIVFLKYLFVAPQGIVDFYATTGLLGLFFGSWVVAGMIAAEQTGTNIRATVVTTAPNFSRAFVIPMNMAFGALAPRLGDINAVGAIGFIIFTASLWGWFNIDETYGANLDYEET